METERTERLSAVTACPVELGGTAERCHDPYLRCALYGAAQAALGVKGSCVLAHSPQGCFQLVDAAFGWQDADYTETLTLCTKLCEDEIVHGGEDLLARTILEARELDVLIMFVVTACGPEIVGDDIDAVCEDVAGEVDFDIVPIRSAGFLGDQNAGADTALDVMLKHLVPPRQDGRRIPRSVCLIAPHASGNPTWMGDLAWVVEILGALGGAVVATLTHDTALEDFARVPYAEGSIVLSHDAGRKAADYLEQEYGIRPWCAGLPLPVGFANTRRWLLELGEMLDASERAVELVAQGERRVVEMCRRRGLEQSALHRARTAIVADATVGIPLVRFVTEDLEMIPELVCLRSGQPDTGGLLERELADLSLTPRVIQPVDVYQARAALGEVRPEMVLGSNIERHAAEGLGLPYVFRVVNPVARFRLTDRAYFGYTGMLNLIEIIQNDWWDRYRSQRRRYKARW